MLPYLRLLRPANIITAWADILLGAAAAGVVFPIGQGGADSYGAVGWLILATTGLYGGGVVFNDIFDRELDLVERPERPLPSGQARVGSAMLLGIAFLLAGVAAAAQVSPRSAGLAFAVGLLAVVYDAFGKHHSWLGPLNMGACRGGNLLLGMSLFPLPGWSWLLAAVPVLYIAAITLVSRGEVGGSGRRPLYLGLIAYSLVTLIILTVLVFHRANLATGFPFVLVFTGLVFPPLLRALRHPSGPMIGKAVRAGVIALIALDAALAAAFAGWPAGLLILLLLPLSLLLARFFAVT